MTLDPATWTSIWNIQFQEGIHCTKFGHFQAEGLNDIARTTFVQKQLWPCDYHWTHIGVIYSPDASTVQTLGTLQKSKDRPTDRPTERPTGAKEGGGAYKIKWICYINAFPSCFHWTSKLKKSISKRLFIMLVNMIVYKL